MTTIQPALMPQETLTVLETSAPLGANEIEYGDPVDCAAGCSVTWRVFTDQPGTNPTMGIEESLNGGTTWRRIRWPDGYSAIEPNGQGFYAGELTGSAPPGLPNRLLRLVYFNGATAQGVREQVRTIA
jgi:hypothetical protein